VAFKFIDPDNDYYVQIKHIKQVWRNEERDYDIEKGTKPPKIFGIEKFTVIVMAVLQLFLPSTIVRYLRRKLEDKEHKIYIDLYASLLPIVFFLLLLYGNTQHITVLIITSWFLVDVITYHVHRLFLSSQYKRQASINRSIILLFVNLMQVVVCFAVLYQGSSSVFNTHDHKMLNDGIDAFYFSFITFTGLGNGDFSPFNTTGRLLVVWEVMTSFMFVSTVVVNFVGQMVKVNEKLK
jgi:membrane protein YdbS with pleckstrin-like domain